MRRVGIDDSRLFQLAGQPYALFAGVAPVGQAQLPWVERVHSILWATLGAS